MNTIIKIGIAFVIPGVLSLMLTPLVIRLANFIGAIDHPDERKVHSHPIPRLGGVAIFTSFLASLVIFFFFDPTRTSSLWVVSHQGIMLIASLLLVFLLGMWDDLHSLKPGQKFLIQLIAATIAYLAGFRISSVTHPLGESMPLALGVLDFPATILWIVGVSNAFNLVDGLDGLASGIGLIAASTIGAIAYLNGDMTTAIPAFILGGALIGFLWYNFNPARIFLGDSGSLFIGFALAILSMQSSTKGSTAFAIVVPILCVGLPIMDTLLSMTRRLLDSLLPEKLRRGSFLHKLHSMFLPDKKHIHHQLLARGYSQRRAVLTLYVVSCLFGLGAFGVTILNNTQASLILIAVAIATMIGVRQLHYREMALFHNGILLTIYDFPVVNRGFFQVFMDLVFSLLAFRLSLYLIPQQSLVHDFEHYLHPLLAVVCGLQVAVFALLGLYQRTFRYLGVGDLLKIIQVTALAVIATGLALILLPHPWNIVNLSVIVTDFYLLLTFIAGSRSSFHVLNFLFRRERKGKKGVLIYGADTKGMLALQQILHDDNREMTPLGFLDDKPQMEGKRINNYPVFGGHWKLPQLIRKHQIDQILISNGNISPEAFNRLKDFAMEHGITLRRSKVMLEDVLLTPRKIKRPLVYSRAHTLATMPLSLRKVAENIQ